jgi:hypothetical protein
VLCFFCSVKERNEARSGKPSADEGNGKQKIGFVPRARVGGMKESGLASTSGKKKGEALDEDSRLGLERVKAGDAEIDQDLDDINNSLAGLGNVAGQMRDEVRCVHMLLVS